MPSNNILLDDNVKIFYIVSMYKPIYYKEG
jgi:hypothetical protein